MQAGGPINQLINWFTPVKIFGFFFLLRVLRKPLCPACPPPLHHSCASLSTPKNLQHILWHNGSALASLKTGHQRLLGAGGGGGGGAAEECQRQGDSDAERQHRLVQAAGGGGL